MKLWFYAFFMAWGMFLAIPCPFPKWDEAARGRMLVCLPLVGVIVGGFWALAAWLTQLIALPQAVAALILAALPWLITGFIHLDGFSDVCDAMLSHRDLQTRQRILKDPHCGAFGVICLLLLVLAQFAVFFSVRHPLPEGAAAAGSGLEGAKPLLFPGLTPDPKTALLVSIGLIPVATRACARLAVLSLRPMKTSQYAGLSDTEKEKPAAELKTEGVEDLSMQPAAKAEAYGKSELASELAREKRRRGFHRALLVIMLLASVAVPVVLFGSSGLAPAAAAAGYWLFALIAFRNLDGMSGDISGFALTLGELIGAAVLIFLK